MTYFHFHVHTRKHTMMTMALMAVSISMIVLSNVPTIVLDQGTQISNQSAQKPDNGISASPAVADPILNGSGGITTGSVAKFNTVENTTSLLYSRDFQAKQGRLFNLTTPANWTIDDQYINVNPYTKKQQIVDPSFSQGPWNGMVNAWESFTLARGTGTITQSYLPNATRPQNVATYLKAMNYSATNQAFRAGDYGYWHQKNLITNPGGLMPFPVQEGKLYQPRAQGGNSFGSSINGGFPTNPNFNTDLNAPYGGTNRPDDAISLIYDQKSLVINILPGETVLGGNPSAAWWYSINIPYAADFAQLKITWAIDPSSSFNASNLYQVCARINDAYIDGRSQSIGGMLIARNDSLPLAGDAKALVVYNGTIFTHGYITRTYNVTRLVSGLVGANKFDFGVWCKNPTHGGIENPILARYKYVEIDYNTTTKYEVARLEFDYMCMNLGSSGGGSGNIPLSQLFANKGSIFLHIFSSKGFALIRVLPFNSMIISSNVGSFNHVSFSLPQQYKNMLSANDVSFWFGVLFEKDWYAPVNYVITYDNMNFTINYGLPSVTSPAQVQMAVDGSMTINWMNLTSNTTLIDTAIWIPGGDHALQFRTTNPVYMNALYLNIISRYDGHLSRNKTAFARYSIPVANSLRGNWNVTYNNSFSYGLLQAKNATGRFNISVYSISYLNMPAFDNKGSRSTNWQIYAVYAPNFLNYTGYGVRFNYTTNTTLQSGRINQALMKGNWTITAWQPNYLKACTLNNTFTYGGLPAFYKGSSLKYNLTLLQAVSNGYSNVSLNTISSRMAGYPKYSSTSGQYVSSTLPVNKTYAAGKYYIYFYWNDTVSTLGNTLRFGSFITSFNAINATNVTFTSTTGSVIAGSIANFTIRYQTNDTFPVVLPLTIIVYDNTTGTLKRWGLPWNGTYQVKIDNSSAGSGYYSFKLYTTGATSGTRKVVFSLFKPFNQAWNKTRDLDITTGAQVINVTVLSGATKTGVNSYNISATNIPYVNDTINSHLVLNLTDQNTHAAINNGLVIGHIGTKGKYVTAMRVASGIYNFTLDTTGLDWNSSTALYISCSASGFSPTNINVTTAIKKILTTTTINSIQPVYEGGAISVIATFMTLINPAAPVPYNFGTLTYHVYQGPTLMRSGPLSLLMSGVYTSTVTIAGLLSGNYSVRVNSTSNNCLNSTSNMVNLIIFARHSTQLVLALPSAIRILKPFEISASLGYQANGTVLPNQTITLNIKIGSVVNYVVTGTADATGTITYNDIIDSRYLGYQFNVTASFNGGVMLAPCTASAAETVQDRIPINMTIVQRPASLRVGYPATYVLRINITDPSESVLNRLIMFVAWYDGNLLAPFLTQQLRTDASGVTSYTISEIADGTKNLTVVFEYGGSTTVAYNNTILTQLISPKWTSSFTASISPAAPSIIRFGQTITFFLNFTCENTTISLQGLHATFTFQYLQSGTMKTETYTAYITSNKTALLAYSIADSFDGSLTVTIAFPGTNQIYKASQVLNMVVSPKIQVNLDLTTAIQSSYLLGSYFFSVSVTDKSTGQPLPGLTIIFSCMNQRKNVTTDANGVAVVSLELNQVNSGVSITVIFVERAEYAGATITSSTFNVIDQLVYFVQNYLPFIGIVAGIIAIATVSVYRGYVIPKRNRTRASLRQMYSRLSDIENIAYILVLNKGGIPMFSKSLAEVPIDESLVSGFLSAISSFGTEISTKMKKGEGGLEELSYQQFKIILDEGQYIRVALLLLRKPSDTLKARLKMFTQAFEKEFSDSVVNFKGEVMQDMVVTPVIERVLEADLLYPHRVIEPKVKPYAKELPKKSVTKKVLNVATGNEFDSIFYVRELINNLKTSMGVEEPQSFDSIQKLKADQVVFAINPRTNYIIDQLRPYIKAMTPDDRSILFAISENNTDGMSIQKYLNKNKFVVTTDMSTTLMRLKSMHVIEADNTINSTGSAIVTLLRLIPDL